MTAEFIDLFSGRFQVGDRVLHGYDGSFSIYTVESVHPAGLRLSCDGELFEARVESLGWFGPDKGEVFGIRDLWLVDSTEELDHE